MRRGKGLTLIEVMLSLALSAVLMTAVLGSLTRLARADKQVTAQGQQDWQLESLRQLLQRDLESATEMSFQGQVLTMRTFHSVDAKTGTESQLPCKVSYVVVQKGDQRWLCRQEQSLTDMGATRRELIGRNMALLAIQGGQQGGAQDGKPLPAVAGQGMAAKVRVAAMIDGKSAQWVFCLR